MNKATKKKRLGPARPVAEKNNPLGLDFYIWQHGIEIHISVDIEIGIDVIRRGRYAP